MKIQYFFFILTGLFLLGCDAPNSAVKNTKNNQTTSVSDIRIAFYNVENLFDTEKHPTKPDEEFTPDGRNKWTVERYNTKLDQLGKVINAMSLPTFLGVCEVENEKVLLDLAANEQLKAGNYGVAHRESNDYRGIDVALLYNKDVFEVEKIENTVLTFPKSITGGQSYTSRDIFHVTGAINSETWHIFVNHWPSRRGGLKESEPKRTFVAGELKKQINAVLEKDKNAYIVIMGDFNDETDNKSITETLGAIAENTEQEAELVNCFASYDAEQKGSYNYRGNWNMLDQIILSDNFYDKKPFQFKSAIIFQQEWMMYNDKRNGAMPNRTYGGPNYYGGFSDHLPVYVDISATPLN